MFSNEQRKAYSAIARETYLESCTNCANGQGTELFSYQVEFELPPAVLSGEWAQSEHGPCFLDTIGNREAAAAPFGLLHGRRSVTIRSKPDHTANPLSERYDPGLSAVIITALPLGMHAVKLVFGELRAFKDLVPWVCAVRVRALEFMSPDFRPARVTVSAERVVWNYAHFCYVLPFLDNPFAVLQDMRKDIKERTEAHLREILDEDASEQASRKFSFLAAALDRNSRRALREWIA